MWVGGKGTEIEKGRVFGSFCLFFFLIFLKCRVECKASRKGGG